MNKDDVIVNYNSAKERFAEIGVDTDKALEILQNVHISLHCWQGDDVIGFEQSAGALSGGIMTTGNYPGRACTPEELRQDLEEAFALIPGKQRVNLHAIYLETDGKQVGRDEIEIKYFEKWMNWAKRLGVSLDFNPSMFSHPLADGYTLASYDKQRRDFWIEHGRRCREIGAEMGRRQGNPCVINHWMVDGSKEPPVDRYERRKLYAQSMDEILSEKISKDYLLDSIESKLFGIGMESFTAGSNEMCFGYALTRGIMATFDLGHFHPTESVADKISSALIYMDKLLLHVSRGIRWDSDHVVIQNDETALLMQEIIRAGALDRVYIALDYFDASINRIAAWVLGTRSTQKALLSALLEPTVKLKELEQSGDNTARLILLEEQKNMPVNDVWNYFCQKNDAPVGAAWLDEIKKYEKDVLAKRD